MCDPSYYVKEAARFRSELCTGYVLMAFLLSCIRPYSNKNFTEETYNKMYERAGQWYDRVLSGEECTYGSLYVCCIDSGTEDGLIYHIKELLDNDIFDIFFLREEAPVAVEAGDLLVYNINQFFYTLDYINCYDIPRSYHKKLYPKKCEGFVDGKLYRNVTGFSFIVKRRNLHQKKTCQYLRKRSNYILV
jgi:hypothetical protein